MTTLYFSFVSSLLTGVLMYHLAWVPTVTPSGETQASYADKHSPKWVCMAIQYGNCSFSLLLSIYLTPLTTVNAN